MNRGPVRMIMIIGRGDGHERHTDKTERVSEGDREREMAEE